MRWSWRGAVALVIAACVAGGWATALVISAIHPDTVGERGGTLLYTLGGTMIGGVIGWLAGRGGGSDADDS
jgi:hypothetical protein